MKASDYIVEFLICQGITDVFGYPGGMVTHLMDSIPTLFITGQVNSFEQKGELSVRQRGFQETDIVSMVRDVTKYAVRVNDASRLKYYLNKAVYIANEGRKGPVLLDIAMDVTRADINPDLLEGFVPERTKAAEFDVEKIRNIIGSAARPVFCWGMD